MEIVATLILFYLAVGAALFAHARYPGVPQDFDWRSQIGDLPRHLAGSAGVAGDALADCATTATSYDRHWPSRRSTSSASGNEAVRPGDSMP